MPIYEWKCDTCEIYWEDLYNKPDDAPQKRKCPECKKLRPRAVSTFGMKFVGSGFYCNDYGTSNWKHKNQLGAVEEFNEGAKKASLKRMDSGWQNYAKYTPDIEAQMKDGRIKKRKSDKEISETIKTSKKLTDSAYDNAGIDPIENITKKPQ